MPMLLSPLHGGGDGGGRQHRECARAALSVPAPDPVIVESVAAFMHRIDRTEWARCPHCGQGVFVPTAPTAPTPLRVPFSRGPP